MPITARGKNPDKSKPPDLTNSGVGGVQMAEVAVDIETGIVKIKKMVAVQDCGLIIDLKTAESQVYGALIMGISYALFEEKVMDPVTGRMLNPTWSSTGWRASATFGELVVHMMTGKGYDERGVIGLGEPPVISPRRRDRQRGGQRHRRPRAEPAADPRARAGAALAERRCMMRAV